MLVPAITSTGTRNSSSTFRTPMCAAPRAPPPERTSPIFGRFACASAAMPGAGAVCARSTAGRVQSRQAIAAPDARVNTDMATSRPGVPGRAARTGDILCNSRASHLADIPGSLLYVLTGIVNSLR